MTRLGLLTSGIALSPRRTLGTRDQDILLYSWRKHSEQGIIDVLPNEVDATRSSCDECRAVAKTRLVFCDEIIPSHSAASDWYQSSSNWQLEYTHASRRAIDSIGCASRRVVKIGTGASAAILLALKIWSLSH